MTLFIYYRDWAGTFDVDLGSSALRLGNIEGLSEMAETGSVGASGLEFDDPNANLGYSGDAIRGHKTIQLIETACAVGNRRLYTGFTGPRAYSHSTEDTGSLRLSTAREIDVDLVEINAVLGFRRIPPTVTAAKRSAESVSARLTWIIGSAYLSDLVIDDGLVDYPPSPTMDAADYRQATPLQVLEDCALASGYDFFVVFDDERDTKGSLFFDDFLRSSAYSTTHRLSSVNADRDSTVEGGEGGTKTWSSGPARLVRSPDRVYSGAIMPYRKGNVFRSKASTATTFIERDGIAPAAYVKNRTRAQEILDRFLNENDTETDVISTSVELPVASVNGIRRGHRMSVKFPHLPGYSSFTDVRVLSRTIRSTTTTDDRYTLDLTLIPCIAAVACNPDTATNLALTATVTGYTDGPTGGTTNLAAPVNVTRVNDGTEATGASAMNSTLIEPAYTGNTYYRGWTITLAGSSGVGFIDTRKAGGDPHPDTFEYYDGSWHTLAPTFTSFADAPSIYVRRATFTPVTCTAVRITYSVYCGGGLPYGFSFDGANEVDEIRVLECAV